MSESRIEAQLDALIDGTFYTEPPQSRTEAILQSIIDDTEYTEPPESRIEEKLLELKEVIDAGEITVEPLSVTDNGTYTAPTGKAYSPVSVDVEPDLTTKNITANGTYTAAAENKDGFSAVTVDVQPSLAEKTITENGEYLASADNVDGYSKVTVDVPSEDADLFGVPATAQNPKLFTATFSTTGTTAALAKMAEYWPFDEVTQDGKYYWGEDNYFSNDANDANDAYVYAYNGSTYLNYFGSMSGESDKTVVIGENFFLGIFSRCAIFCGYAEDEDGLTKKCIGLIPFTDHSDPVCFAFDDGERIFYKNQYYGTYGSSNAFNQYTKILYGATKYTIKDLQIMLAWQYRPTDPGAECTIGDNQAYLYSSIAALAKTPTAHAEPPIEFESDGSNLKNWAIFGNDPGVGEQTKNLCEILIPNGFERNGVVATVDKNAGTVIINGDTTPLSSGFSISLDNSLNPITGISGNYTLTGCPDGGSSATFDLYVYDITASVMISPRVYSSTESVTFTADPLHEYRVYIQLRKGNIYNDVTFRPMLRPADTSAEFEPYGYKIPIETRERGDNLIRCTNTTSTTGGGAVISQTAGMSEIVIVSRSTTDTNGSVPINVLAELSAGTYTLSVEGIVDRGAGNLDRILISSEDGIIVNYVRTGNPQQFTISEDVEITKLTFVFAAEAEYSNQVVRVMLNAGSTALPYDPYWKVADTTPIYTQTQLGTGDTITKEQTGVDIPTVDGENYITVATTTQPAAMTIAYAEPEPEE